ncbi:MAG: 50S ribosomal protein L24 [Desulfovibrionales bacterium]|nr:50S ribosomal protein L24 [Desulfovibrionales bacterium]
MSTQVWKVHLNDTVMVMTGKDKGKIGKVIKVLRAKKQVVVEKANIALKHSKPNPYANKPGGIVEKEMPIDISNVQVVCSSCTKPARLGYRLTDDNKKIRYCRKCNEAIS